MKLTKPIDTELEYIEKNGEYYCYIIIDEESQRYVSYGNSFVKIRTKEPIMALRFYSISDASHYCRNLNILKNGRYNVLQGSTVERKVMEYDFDLYKQSDFKMYFTESYHLLEQMFGDKQAQRNTNEYKEWRLQVFRRDGFACQECGMVGEKLNAHHIKSFAEHEELRTDIDNGVTLCEKCHKKLHWGV